MIYRAISYLDRQLNFTYASAHCDIPCKIYDPAAAQMACLTIIRMLDLLAEVDSSHLAGQAQLARLVAQKEQHVQQVKEEVRVIWGDFFKQPQFDQVPNTHELVHNIMLQASKCSQGVERSEGEKLLALVNEFAQVFWLVKGIPTYTAVCPYPPSTEVVYPQLG